MIVMSNIMVQYGERKLFRELNLTITDKDRVGLVGKNGAGKSTLLKIIIGEMNPHEGNVVMENSTTLGYLPQTLHLNPTKSVFEEALEAFSEINRLEADIEEINEELGVRTDYESEAYQKILSKLSDKTDRLVRLGGMNIREEIERVLRGLGFAHSDLDMPLSTFSGGWQMRVELAKILLRKPDYILLDEPTNHLDIESIIWLERFLTKYPGGVLIISHDKAFLDTVGNRTVELVNGKAYDHKVSYSDFIALRQERVEKQIAEAKRQEKFVEHTETLINKFRAKKNKAKFAQTLIKKLDRIEKVEVDDQETGKIRFRFPPAPRSGKVVVNIDSLVKRYDQNLVLNKIDFELERGEKIAFIGRNGEGKTTLTRIITGDINDHTGLCELGHNVIIGYYEQHQAEQLDESRTVFQTIDDVAVGDMRLKVRALLGAFLFSGEDVDKKVSVLSGGERSRLALAKMLLNPVNLLILDEPTNHLDMQSKSVLKQALLNFTGTLLVVSHDREFLKGLTDKVYEFRDKGVHQHVGDIYSFLKDREMKSLDDLGMNSREELKGDKVKREEDKKTRIQKREALKQLEKDLRKVNNKHKKCEQEISKAEDKIAEYEKLMADPEFYGSNPDANKILMDHAALNKRLTTLMEEWEESAMEIEELQEKRTELSS